MTSTSPSAVRAKPCAAAKMLFRGVFEQYASTDCSLSEGGDSESDASSVTSDRHRSIERAASAKEKQNERRVHKRSCTLMLQPIAELQLKDMCEHDKDAVIPVSL